MITPCLIKALVHRLDEIQPLRDRLVISIIRKILNGSKCFFLNGHHVNLDRRATALKPETAAVIRILTPREGEAPPNPL